MKKAIIIAALLCGTAHAEYFTGNDIQKWGEDSSTSNLYFGMMYGYIAGAYDSTAGVIHCAPQSVKLQQIVDMVRNYVTANPAMRHFSGDAIVGFVLGKQWPCPKKGTGA